MVYVELSEDEERIILATLDPIGAMATADREKLSELLQGIDNPDLGGLLEAVARANRLALDFGSAGLDRPRRGPRAARRARLKARRSLAAGRPSSALRRLAPSAEDVRRLMAGERAASDGHRPAVPGRLRGRRPPRKRGQRGRRQPRDKHWDAYIDHEHSVAFYVDFLRAALECALTDDAAVYQWFGIMRTEVIWQAWREVGLLPHQVLIWQKSRSVLTYSATSCGTTSPACTAGREGHMPAAKPPADATAVWEIASTIEDGAGWHPPTMKPVELIRRPIEWHTAPGELIYEPFCGSGTALIAAEMTGRRCYAIELSPAFVDVAVARWQRFTGQTADAQQATEGRAMGNPETGVVQAHERQLQALELRKAGATYQAIAEQLGYAGRQGAYKAVERLEARPCASPPTSCASWRSSASTPCCCRSGGACSGRRAGRRPRAAHHGAPRPAARPGRADQ